MSTARAVWIRCDACPELEQAQVPDSNYCDDRQQAEVQAKRSGWHRSKGRDICPECWKKGRR